jgi:hypothetical protein
VPAELPGAVHEQAMVDAERVRRLRLRIQLLLDLLEEGLHVLRTDVR